MAGRPKGIPKTGGRQKGTPNKVTTELRSMYQEVLTSEDSVGELRKLMLSDDPRDRQLFWTGANKLIPAAVSVKLEEVSQTKTLFYSSRPEDERPAIEAEHTKEPETCH